MYVEQLILSMDIGANFATTHYVISFIQSHI